VAELLGLVNNRIEPVDGVVGSLLELSGEVLSIGGGQLAAGGGEVEEAGIAGDPDVGFLEEFQIRIMWMLLKGMVMFT